MARCVPVGLNANDSMPSIVVSWPVASSRSRSDLCSGFFSFLSFASSASENPTRHASQRESSEKAGCSPYAIVTAAPPPDGWMRSSLSKSARVMP
jgi:hypothetical protein